MFPDDILERNPGGPNEYPIWQVARATLAAPTFFKAMRLEEDDEKAEYIDGSLSAKNPSEEAYRSVKQLSDNNQKAVKILVSIGSGKNLEADPNPSSGFLLFAMYMKLAAKWASQSEATHQTVLDATRRVADYFRFEVEHGIGKIRLDAWQGKKGIKTLQLIRIKTEVYLQIPEVQKQITLTARHLVDVRRARSTQLDRWERFCQGVDYVCCMEFCDYKDEKFKGRQHLRRHLEQVHQSDPAVVEFMTDQGKRFPPDTGD
ncbi:hypothetical protein OEA41_007557 [Lepraria neglecta]|uniref:PNPLA domain-containing protein n=1 Tax=Lepraria neglecta TaxID=209136 RepID=A0AAE0DN72_9LECA|nr:hypothetical protein OEA41_007557 [Lepraria neglecta]